jgi:hypothetical protein
MSVHELSNQGARQEANQVNVIGNYPYENLSVSAMAQHLSERIERNRVVAVEPVPDGTELLDAPDSPEISEAA